MSVFGPVPEYRRKVDRVRGVIILCAAITCALVATLCSFSAQYVKAQSVMLESSQVMPGVDVNAKGEEDSLSQQVFAPDLVSLLGKNVDSAIAELEHGATVVKQTDSIGLGGKPVASYEVALTGEPADTLAGPPTVYLTADEAGNVFEAGYQVGMRYLGYGSLSMADAVENVHVIEKLLSEAGMAVAEGTLSLPEDSSEYTVFGSDGVTIVSQECSFSGVVAGQQSDYSWRGIMSYDYSDANARSNMAYTLRKVSVYVSAV